MIKNFLLGFSNGLGIDFGNQQLVLFALGRDPLDRGFSEQLAIGNSSTTTPGVLRLNGATVAGTANVLVAVTNESYGPSYLWNAPSSPRWAGGDPAKSGGPTGCSC